MTSRNNILFCQTFICLKKKVMRKLVAISSSNILGSILLLTLAQHNLQVHEIIAQMTFICVCTCIHFKSLTSFCLNQITGL